MPHTPFLSSTLTYMAYSRLVTNMVNMGVNQKHSGKKALEQTKADLDYRLMLSVNSNSLYFLLMLFCRFSMQTLIFFFNGMKVKNKLKATKFEKCEDIFTC